MIRLILFLVAVAALAYAGTWLVDNPGAIVLTWQGYLVETSVAVLLVGLLLLTVALVVLVEVLRWLLGVPRRIVEARARSRQVRGYRELALGLVAAAAGDPAQARGHHRKAERLLGNSPATLLLAAQAAQLEGQEQDAERKFERMLESPETEFLGLRGLLAQAMKAGDTEQALALARRAYMRRPRTPWVLNTLFDLQTRSGRWEEALQTVKDMQRARLLDPAQATRRRAILHHMAAEQRHAQGELGEALKLARRAVELAPGFAPAAVQASAYASEAERPRLARKLLERAWSAMPHPALARAYAQLEANESAEQRLQRLEALWELQPNHAETQIALAEAALQAGKWEKARAHLERAERARPSARVYRLLAELERASNGDASKINAWLAKAVEAEPDPAWVCEATGVALLRWSAFGPAGNFDSVRWGTPPRVTAMVGEEPRILLANGGGAEPEKERPAPAKGDGGGAAVDAAPEAR